MNIQTEIERRESEFVNLLNSIGQNELATLYDDIITLRKAAEVLARNTRLLVAKPAHFKVTAGQPSNPEFNLRNAVREQIKELGQRSFTTRQMFEWLSEKYPDEVGKDKLPSVSATLANLFTKKELRKSKDALGKLTFQATEWE